uniref:Uncharacterized protein n=1 Tax=Trichogramma kaykai TaxID=54128 RepID=A0ABD2XIZ5_9HYME
MRSLSLEQDHPSRIQNIYLGSDFHSVSPGAGRASAEARREPQQSGTVQGDHGGAQAHLLLPVLGDAGLQHDEPRLSQPRHHFRGAGRTGT